jgi:hypothetical protein
LLNQSARNGHVLRNRQKIQLRPAQHGERIAHLIEKSFCRNDSATAYCHAHNVENVLMPRPSWMQMQIEIARQRFEFLLRKLLQLVQIKRARRCSGGRVGRVLFVRNRHAFPCSFHL